MNITFTSLTESHFPLLLKWLETTHVKLWWDQDVKWTPELIQEKYGSYVKGYKLAPKRYCERSDTIQGNTKSLRAFIANLIRF